MFQAIYPSSPNPAVEALVSRSQTCLCLLPGSEVLGTGRLW